MTRTAVVIGAASGLGWRIAQTLASDGFTVVLADRNADGAREHAALVSLASLNGRQPAIGMSAYCSAKAGLAMLTQVAALELGPKGVRVNAVSPGFVPTPLTEGAALVPGVIEEYVENTALGRTGTPQDVADAVSFLCSDKASWITGDVLDVNGGAHLKRYPDIQAHVMKLAGQPVV